MTDKQPLTLAGMRILAVEDDYMVAELLRDMLEDLGCVVIGPFPNCAAGLAAIEENLLDGAVIDANLGKGLTSAPVAAALNDASVPFIVATGYGTLMLSDDALDRAPRITKPFDEAELKATAIAAFIRPIPADDHS